MTQHTAMIYQKVLTTQFDVTFDVINMLILTSSWCVYFTTDFTENLAYYEDRNTFRVSMMNNKSHLSLLFTVAAGNDNKIQRRSIQKGFQNCWLGYITATLD